MSDDPPVRLRVVRGHPDATEVAAVLVALATRSTSTDDSNADHARGGWGDREARLRLAVHPAPGAWRASGRAGR